MTNKPDTPPQLVWIKWIDACYQNGPCTDKDLDSQCEMRTAGLFIREADNAVTVALDYFEEEKVWGHIKHIPKVNIIEMRRFDISEGTPETEGSDSPPPPSQEP